MHALWQDEVAAPGHPQHAARIEEALRERTPAEPIAWDASLADVRLHARLVDCIVSGDSESAADVMAQIVQGASR